VKSQQALIAQGVAGRPVTRPEKRSHKAAIVDIAKALQKSLAALKKPAASEQAARKDAKAAGTQHKKIIGQSLAKRSAPLLFGRTRFED
jgi:non-homologous end joining protein Ku